MLLCMHVSFLGKIIFTNTIVYQHAPSLFTTRFVADGFLMGCANQVWPSSHVSQIIDGTTESDLCLKRLGAKTRKKRYFSYKETVLCAPRLRRIVIHTRLADSPMIGFSDGNGKIPFGWTKEC